MKKNDIREKLLRERQLYSHGRILSSFTHELNNHIAIIRESAGLLQDYVEMGRVEDTVLSERIARLVLIFEERVRKIGDMSSILNSFSHRFDEVISPFCLNELIQEQLFLLNRLATMKKVTVVNNLSQRKLTINNTAAIVQHVIIFLFHISLSLLCENNTLTISSCCKEKGAEVIFSLENGQEAKAPELIDNLPEDIVFSLEMIGGTILYTPAKKATGHDCLSFALIIEF